MEIDWTFGGSWPHEPRWFDSADAEPLVRSHGIAFHHIPVTKDNKAEAEARGAEAVSCAR